MTVNEIFFRNEIAQNIPLVNDGVKLSKSTLANVMLLRASCEKQVQNFESEMSECLTRLKQDGFDKRKIAYEEMKMVDKKKYAHDNWDGQGEKPDAPTKEELLASEETRLTAKDFEKEENELKEAYFELRKKASEKDIRFNASISRDDFADICEIVGIDGDMNYRKLYSNEIVTVQKKDFLSVIASNLVL